MGCKQLRRILDSFEDNILVQELDKPTRNESLLDRVLTNAVIVKEVKIGVSVGCNDHALVEIMILKYMALPGQRAESEP